jgi:hypothetical protein
MLGRLKKEFINTALLYYDIIRKPYKIATGVYNVVTDVLKQPKKKENLEEYLSRVGSHSIAISELLTIPGTYFGAYLFNRMGFNEYASIIGGHLGNLLVGDMAYIASYVTKSRGLEGYSFRRAVKDSLRFCLDVLPTDMILYMAESPFISGMIMLGMKPEISSVINLGVNIGPFSGIAKNSVDRIATRAAFPENS